MGFSVREPKSKHDFSDTIRHTKVPILVLDQKWHHIFVGDGKPEAIAAQERRVNELLAAQGREQQDEKDLRKLKRTLMKNIMENMDGTEGENELSAKKLSEDRRLINDINDKLKDCEDNMAALPKQLEKENQELMRLTMEYCYGQLHDNAREIEETGAWIRETRVELKKQVIRKQNAEQKSKEIYAYLHDIFGPKVIDVFDLKYEADGTGQEERAERTEKKGKRAKRRKG